MANTPSCWIAITSLLWSDAFQIFFKCLFDLIGRIGHSTVNPFEDNIPNGAYIKGNQVVRLEAADHLGKRIMARIHALVEFRYYRIQLQKQEMKEIVFME